MKAVGCLRRKDCHVVALEEPGSRRGGRWFPLDLQVKQQGSDNFLQICLSRVCRSGAGRMTRTRRRQRRRRQLAFLLSWHMYAKRSGVYVSCLVRVLSELAAPPPTRSDPLPPASLSARPHSVSLSSDTAYSRRPLPSPQTVDAAPWSVFAFTVLGRCVLTAPSLGFGTNVAQISLHCLQLYLPG